MSEGRGNGNGWIDSWAFIIAVHDIESNHLDRMPGVILASKRDDVAAGILVVAYARKGAKTALRYLKALDEACPASAARVRVVLRQMPLPSIETLRGLVLSLFRGP